jgi:hypothetical protein
MLLDRWTREISYESKMGLILAEKELTYMRMGYRPGAIQSIMVNDYRDLAEARRKLQVAKDDFDRFEIDVKSRYGGDWPQCDDKKSEGSSSQ